MTTTLIVPRQDVPIGRTADGRPVYFDANFIRSFLQGLMDRVGGTTSQSITEVINNITQGSGDTEELGLLISSIDDTIHGISPSDAGDSNYAAVQAAVAPAGSFFEADKVRATFALGGMYTFNGLVDLHPSVSLPLAGRGSIIWQPGDNLPGMTANFEGFDYGAGAESAALRLARDTPDSDNTIAWSPDIGGFNLDFRDSSQHSAAFTIDTAGNTLVFAQPHPFKNGWTVYPSAKPLANISSSIKAGNQYTVGNVTSLTLQLLDPKTLIPTTLSDAGGAVQTLYVQIDGIRIPDPQTSNNSLDPDPDFDTKKDYVAGYFHDMDIIGCPGYGWHGEPGNGRANFQNLRLLNCDLDGAYFQDNDKALGGHGASGGNGQSGKGFGYHFGQASGVYMVTQNVWGCDDATIRNAANAAACCHLAQAYFGCAANNFNEANRFIGGANFNNAGVYGINQYHPHGNLFTSDGVAGDAYSTGDSSLQSHNAVMEYQGLIFAFNSYVRTDQKKPAGSLPTPGNFGGDLSGAVGTAFQTIVDVTQAGNTRSMVVSADGVCSAPDVKSWTSLPQAVTLVSNVGGFLTFTCTAHGMQPNTVIGMYCNGTPPSGVTVGPSDPVVVYWVDTPNNDTFRLYAAPIADFTAAPLPFVDAGTFASLTFYNLTTSPYVQDNGNSITYGNWDCYTALFRAGAKTPKSNNLPSNSPLMGSHAHAAICIAEDDNANSAYVVEIGDRTTDPVSGALWRNILYGVSEFDHAPSMSWKAWRRITTSNGGSANIRAYEPLVFFTTGGAGIASYNPILPTGMLASYRATFVFKGGAIALNTWTGPVNTNSTPLPALIGLGWTAIEAEWLADAGEWNVLNVWSDNNPTLTLVQGGSGAVATDLSQGNNFYVLLTQNGALQNPTNPRDGILYTWLVQQDGTGSRTLSLGGKFKKPATIFGQVATIAFSTTPNAIDKISARYNAANDAYYVEFFGAAFA